MTSNFRPQVFLIVAMGFMFAAFMGGMGIVYKSTEAVTIAGLIGTGIVTGIGFELVSGKLREY